MKQQGVFVALFAFTGCATTSSEMMTRAPFRSYVSSKHHAEIGQCIAATVPGTFVLPGPSATIVNVQNPGGEVLLTWRVEDGGSGGSRITVWRANSAAPGISRAERCF